MTFKKIRTSFLISLTSETIADLQFKYWNFTKDIGLNWKMGEKRKKKKKPKQKFPLGSLGKKKKCPFYFGFGCDSEHNALVFYFFCLFTIFSDF